MARALQDANDLSLYPENPTPVKRRYPKHTNTKDELPYAKFSVWHPFPLLVGTWMMLSVACSIKRLLLWYELVKLMAVSFSSILIIMAPLFALSFINKFDRSFWSGVFLQRPMMKNNDLYGVFFPHHIVMLVDFAAITAAWAEGLKWIVIWGIISLVPTVALKKLSGMIPPACFEDDTLVLATLGFKDVYSRFQDKYVRPPVMGQKIHRSIWFVPRYTANVK